MWDLMWDLMLDQLWERKMDELWDQKKKMGQEKVQKILTVKQMDGMWESSRNKS